MNLVRPAFRRPQDSAEVGAENARCGFSEYIERACEFRTQGRIQLGDTVSWPVSLSRSMSCENASLARSRAFAAPA